MVEPDAETGQSQKGERNAQVVAAGRDLHRRLHAAGRRDDRQRGAAGHGPPAAHDLPRPAVGDRPVRAGARRAGADRGQHRRPVRPQAALPGRADPVRGVVAHLRPRAERGRADRRPRRAGARRGGDVRDHDGADQQHLHRPGPGRRVRRLGGGQRGGRRRRADRGRAADGELRLALDLPGQPAGQRRRGRAHGQDRDRVPRPEPQAGRPARHGDVHRRRRRADLRADPRRLDLADDDRAAGGHRRRDRGVRRRRAAQRRARCSTSPCSGTARSPRC